MSTVRPRVSIVVPTHDNLALTEQCLDAIERTGPPGSYELVVVDNASTDGTVDWLRAREAEARLRAVANDENLGFARACNQGAALARGEVVLFLNNDTIPHAGWLDAVLAELEEHPDTGVVGSKLLYADGTVQHAGVVVGEHDGDPSPYHVYLCQPADAPHVSRRRELQMVTGACLAIRRELLERVGGLDEAYWNGHEDLDLCLKARAAGAKVVYRPDSVVTHLESQTKRLLGLEQFHYAKGADTPEARGRRLFLERWRDTLEIDDRRILAEDGLGTGSHVLFTMVGWADEGGGTILPRQIAKALVRHGHRVTVLYAPVEELPGKPPYHLEASVEDGVRLLALYNRPSRFNDPLHPEREVEDPAVEQLVAELVAQLEPDVAHLHSLLGFSMALPRALDAAGVPSVYTSHNYWPLCPRMYLFRRDLSLCDGPAEDGGNCAPCLGAAGTAPLYADRLAAGRTMLGGHVDRHLAVSHRVRELFVRAGHDAERIHVLHQQPESVDWLWNEVGSRREPVAALKRPLRVGFIGSLYAHKGVHVLVQAVQAFEPGEIEVHLHGGGAEAYAESLRGLDEKGLVRFHGGYETRELPQLLGEVDVVCVPSAWEDCAPLVVAEALAARAPVVGSRIGGIGDFLEDGKTGLLVEPGDAGALAAALRRFLEDRALLGRMQAAIAPPKGFDAYLDELVAQYEGAAADRLERAAAHGSSHPVWRGDFGSGHSLSVVNDGLVGALERAGVDVSRTAPVAPVAETDVVGVAAHWPPSWEAPTRGPFVLYQPWEFGEVPALWSEQIRTRVDEVWTASEYARESYLAAGLAPELVHVVPNGVDLDRFSPDGPARPVPERPGTVFLFVGGTTYRKGIDLLLEAYGRAFTADDDVLLAIKGFGSDSHYRGQTAEDEIEAFRSRPWAPRVLPLDEHLAHDEIPALYRAADCVVQPYRGEGFCLPALEALACGRPVIVTAGGPTDDFVSDACAWRVPSQRIPLPPGSLSGDYEIAGGGFLLEPDLDALVEALRAAADPALRAAKAAHARSHAEPFSWDAAAEVARRRLEALRGRTPIRDVAPAAVPGAKRILVAVDADWDDTSTWAPALEAYAAAFGPDDPTTLVLPAADEATAAARVGAHLDAASIDADALADVVLASPASLDESALELAVDAYVCGAGRRPPRARRVLPADPTALRSLLDARATAA